MRFFWVIFAVLCSARPALTQAPTAGAPPKPVQHQPGVTDPSVGAAHASTPEKVDPAKDAAIRHLMDITETSKLGDNIATYLKGQVHDGVGRAIGPEKVDAFMATFNRKFSATSPASAVTDAMVPIYAKAFSMEDIQSLIQFYESPLGQRVVKALPEVVQQSQMAGVQIEQASAMKVLREMVEEYPELKQVLPPENEQPEPGNKAVPPAAPTPTPSSTPKPPPSAPSK
ncbi:MAG TPA: DUF2059 domain-containing protein [Candidatus Acidoferrales bacterium]|nr:DUF2059 domain-containing protein [Candidatus Acidoferrales bacterium]